MRSILVLTLIAFVTALALGVHAQTSPAPARPHDLVAPVSEAWRQALPQDAAAATQAYLNRVPVEMRMRGEVVADSRYIVLAARLIAGIVALLLILVSKTASKLGEHLARVTRARWLQDVMFAAILFSLLFLITLPVETYAGYIRYRQFGFADRPFFDWLADYAITWATLTSFYVVGVAALMAMIRRWPRAWAGWATALYLVLSGLYVVANPVIIEPLTNSYTPLADSPLKRDILAMAQANGVPVDNVFTANASRQSRLLNAHVSGIFGAARISIDDTTLSGQYAPGVLMVVGHEIGHYVMGHIYFALLIGALIAGGGFLLIAAIGPRLVKAFGKAFGIERFDQTAAIAVFWLLFFVWTAVSDPLNNAFSRWEEAQADLYGLNASQAPHGMAEFMIHDADIARLSPTPLDVILFYDHPGDASRVETAMRWRAAHLAANEPAAAPSGPAAAP